MSKILFSEEQRYSRGWIWAILLIVFVAIIVAFGYGIYSEVVLKGKGEGVSKDTIVLIIVGIFTLLIMVAVMVVIFKTRLSVRIERDGLSIANPPFYKKWEKVLKESIDRYEIKDIRFIRRHPSRSNRLRRKYGKIYYLGGNAGLLLYLKDGKKILIGTQKRLAIEYAMEKMMKSEKEY